MAIRKQIAVYLSLDEWRALQRHSAEVSIPICRLVYEWIKPRLDKINISQKYDGDGDDG